MLTGVAMYETLLMQWVEVILKRTGWMSGVEEMRNSAAVSGKIKKALP